MKTAVAIFAKHPEHSPVKTRLAESIGEKAATHIYYQCVSIIEKALREHNLFDSDVTVYWAVADKESLDSNLFSAFNTLHTGDGNLGQRLDHVYKTLLEHHDNVILVGSDCPTLNTQHIDETLSLLDNGYDVVIGPAYDGGFYLFAGNCAMDSKVWLTTPYSVNSTCQILSLNIEHTGLKIAYLEKLYDIDTLSDLDHVLKSCPGLLEYSPT